jgi:hypothetical protein
MEPVYGKKRNQSVPGERKTWIDRYTDSDLRDAGHEFIQEMVKRSAPAGR